MNNFAHLKAESPFYPLFDKGKVPIKNWLVGETGNMLDGGGVQEFYRVDVDRLTPEQFEKIAFMVAGQCKSNPVEVAADMRQRGFIPLRALHVRSTSSDCPAFL